MAEDVENYFSLPLEERLTHKLWKARLEAYEELAKLFARAEGPKDPIFKAHWETVKGLPSENNAAALEHAMGCLLEFLKASDSANKMRPFLFSVMIEKCIAAAKPGVRAKCIEAALLFVESDTFEPIFTELGSFLSHKQPKVVAGSINCITEIIKEFGASKTAVKAVVKFIPIIFQHTDKNVRAEGSLLVIELFKWIGPAINPFLEALKPVQVKELQEQFSKICTEEKVPKRFLQSQQQSRQPANNSVEASNNMEVDSFQQSTEANPPSNSFDPFELAEPVKVLENIPATFNEMIQSAKWSERKECLDELNALMKAPRLEDGPYGPLVQTITKKIADPNVSVVISAANCIESLAKGLRKHFAPYRQESILALLEKCKEKKTNVLEALRSALDAIGQTISNMFDLNDILGPFFSHKNPQIKTETLNWVTRTIAKAKAATRKETKTFVELCLPSIEDSSAEVREAAMKFLAQLCLNAGSQNVMLYIDTIEKSKLSKITELASALSGDVKNKPSVPLPGIPKPNVVAPISLSKMTKHSEEIKLDSESTPKSIQSSASLKALPSKESSGVSFKHTDEEAESKFEEILGNAVYSALSDSNWKTRLEVMDSIINRFKLCDAEIPSAELLVRFLCKRPSWKESNFQVFLKAIQLIDLYIAKNGITREACSLLIPGIIDKISDIKLGSAICEILVKSAESVGLPFVIPLVFASMKNQKNPKTISECIKWVQTNLLAFGTFGVSPNSITEVVKEQVVSSNPTIRSSAIGLAATMRQFYGPDVRGLFNELPGPIINSLDAEFKKVAGDAPPVPTKSVKVNVETSKISQPNDLAGGNSQETLTVEELIERTDLCQSIPPELLAQISDVKWQQRKEALDQILQLVQKARNNIKLTNGDILNELKGRFTDSNKNLVIQALELCGVLGEGCGSTFEKHLRIILGGVISTLSDNKLQVRQAACKCLESLHKACKLNIFIPIVVSSLSAESPNLRKEVLTWTCTAISTTPDQVSKEDLIPLISYCLGLLQDRTMEVRKASQAVIGSCLTTVDPDTIKKLCQEHKPAMLSTVVGVIESVANSTPKQKDNSIASKMPNLLDSGSSNTFLLLTSDPNLKNARAEKDKGGAKWSFESLRKENIDFLKDQMSGNVKPVLIQLLFSEDFKDHLTGLSQLETALNTAGDKEKESIVCNLDLLLKYLTIRFFDTNVSVLMKCFDCLERLLSLVDMANFRLSEYEASCFIHFFITKAGDSKDSLRSRTKGIFRQLCRIYPASKLFSYLVDGLKSKNSRCRAVCLEEMNSLLTRNGLVVINPSKHVPLVAAMISDRDSQTRNASLDVVVKLVSLMGDQLSKYLVDLGQKEMDLLEERLKRSRDKEHQSSSHEDLAEEQQNPSPNDMELSQNQDCTQHSTCFSLDYDQFDSHDRQRLTLQHQATPAPSSKLAEPTPPFPISRLSISLGGPDQHPLDRLIMLIGTCADLPCIQALQKLDEHLTQMSPELGARANSIIPALALRLRDCCSAPPSGIEFDDGLKSRLCRYVTNALVIAVSDVDFALKLTCDSLIALLSETLLALVSKRIESFEDGEQLSRALNILLVKILENSNRNYCYRSLLILLEQVFRIPPQDTEKYPDFIMKCLWKLTKQIPVHLERGELQIDALLQDIHQLFCALPPVEWKTRANQHLPFEDLPLRTIKTVLHELAAVKGSDVIFFVRDIPNAEQSFVTSYLKAMLAANGLEAPSLQAQPDAPAEPAKLSLVEVEMTLKDICSKICSKPNTRSGLLELFGFQKAHPYASEQVNQYLEKLGSFFYKYIRRNLEQLEMEEKARQDFSDSSSNPTVECYKSKLVQIQQIFSSASGGGGGLVSSEEAASPIRARLESPFAKMAKLSAPSPVATKTFNTVKDSSIVNLKERLARLRTSGHQSSQ